MKRDDEGKIWLTVPRHLPLRKCRAEKCPTMLAMVRHPETGNLVPADMDRTREQRGADGVMRVQAEPHWGY